MLMKKVIKDGNTVYVEITKEEAKILREQGEKVFETEDEETKGKYDYTDFSENINGFVRNLTDKINKKFNDKMKSKTSNFYSAFPFMSDEDIHDIFVKMLNDDENFKDESITGILPFLNQEDCDALFLKTIEKGLNISYQSVIPFVSSDCLSTFVDEYLDGKYQDVDIDSFYPFLNSADVKRVFYYKMNK